jgi:hypothetical protein
MKLNEDERIYMKSCLKPIKIDNSVELLEAKLPLKITAIIMIGLLGMTSIIGFFWGTEGLQVLAVVTLLSSVLGIWILGNSL